MAVAAATAAVAVAEAVVTRLVSWGPVHRSAEPAWDHNTVSVSVSPCRQLLSGPSRDAPGGARSQRPNSTASNARTHPRDRGVPRTADSRLDYGWHGLCMERGMLGHDMCIVHGSLWVTQLYRNIESVLCICWNI